MTKSTTSTTTAKTASYDAKSREVVKAIKQTTSPASLALVVKAAIYARDVMLGKELDALELNFNRVADAAARKRVKGLCEKIVKLTDRKGIATVCRIAIKHRAEMKAKAEAKKAAA